MHPLRSYVNWALGGASGRQAERAKPAQRLWNMAKTSRITTAKGQRDLRLARRSRKASLRAKGKDETEISGEVCKKMPKAW